MSPPLAMAGLFHSHLVRLRMNSESNSESRLKTTKKRLQVVMQNYLHIYLT